MRERYGDGVSKDDVFFFLYGLLHSPPEYRERYAGELKQMLPRVPNVPAGTFSAFTAAGRELFRLHADYEDAELYPLEVVGGEQPPLGSPDAAAEYYRVQKMRFPTGKKAADAPDALFLNPQITVRGIPRGGLPLPARLTQRDRVDHPPVPGHHRQGSGIVNDPQPMGGHRARQPPVHPRPAAESRHRLRAHGGDHGIAAAPPER